MVSMQDNEQARQSSLAASSTTDPHDLRKLYELIKAEFSRTHSLAIAQSVMHAIKPIKSSNTEFQISLQSSQENEWLLAQYQPGLLAALRVVVGDQVKVIFVKAEDVPKSEQPQSEFNFLSRNGWRPNSDTSDDVPENLVEIVPNEFRASTLPTPRVLDFGGQKFEDDDDEIEGFELDERFTFDSFVEGPSNRIGLASSKSVVDNPGQMLSPFFIFGPSGLGKTHLLQAIGNALRKKNPRIRILYMSAEQWVNSYVNAVRSKKFDAFRRRFRNGCDIFLVDDVQFFGGKEASQDEFFHTFNSLHHARKQIVVTSDQYPHEIPGFAKRLQTRLSWGMIADIRPPDTDTRVQILHAKAKMFGIKLSDEVASALAQQITQSVRELEGALIRLSTYAAITKEKIDINFVNEHLKPLFQRHSETVTIDKIYSSVCAYYNIRLEDLTGQARQKQVVAARQVAMLLCRSHLHMSLPQIGKLFGGRSHSTVLTAIKRVEELRRTEIGAQSVFTRIEKLLFN